jgi:hypothetical protein
MLSILNQSMCWLLSCVDTWDVYKTIAFVSATGPIPILVVATMWTADINQSIASRYSEYRPLRLLLPVELQLRPHLGTNAVVCFMLCGVTAPPGLLRTAESNLFRHNLTLG